VFLVRCAICRAEDRFRHRQPADIGRIDRPAIQLRGLARGPVVQSNQTLGQNAACTNARRDRIFRVDT
jgi:hypothetical protein